VKFNQPLFGDPVFDFKTAEEFENVGHIEIIGQDQALVFLGGTRMVRYSGWPSLHIITIVLHDITGLSLFDVFTFFPPLLALGSLLFVYLLTDQIFNDLRISALSGLMFATFSITMHWQIQMVRQNIAFTLALMAIYLCIKSQTSKKVKILALSLLSFGILPIAHHLSALELFLVLCTSLFISWLFRSNSWRKIYNVSARRILRVPSVETTIPYLVTLAFCLFVGSSMFLWWTTYADPISLQMAGNKFLSIFSSLLGTETRPYLPKLTQKMGSVIGFYDILSIARLFFYGVATICGVIILLPARGKVNHYKPLLYGLLIVPLFLILTGLFIQKAAEMRHLLFLSIPMFLLVGRAIYNLDKKILAICLLMILVPTPFKLDKTLLGAPTHIYDRSKPYEFTIGEKTDFRSADALIAASFIAAHTNGNVMADSYVGVALLFCYDAQKVFYLSLPFSQKVYYIPSPEKYISDDYVLLIHQKYFGIHKLVKLPPDSEVAEYLDELPRLSDCIYDNGEVKGWKRARALPTNVSFGIPSRATIGEVITLDGILVDQFSRCLINETVKIYISRNGYGWHYITSLTTDNHGVFMWRDRLQETGTFIFAVYYTGSEGYASTYTYREIRVHD
jgi:hypothetical protein